MAASNIKIWDNYNKQWLEAMAIIFDGDGIAMITACAVGEKDVLKNGWFRIEGDWLKHIAIKGSIEMNTELIPLQPPKPLEPQTEELLNQPFRDPCKYCGKKHPDIACEAQVEQLKQRYRITKNTKPIKNEKTKRK